MKVKISTLGCKVNQYESEAMLEMLLNSGFTEAGRNEPADVVIVNSCTVTSSGDQKARQYLRRMKKQNPDAVTVLTGCMPQAFPQTAEELLEADIVLGTTDRGKIAEHIARFFTTHQRIISIRPHEKHESFERLKVSAFHGRTRAFLKIQDGCNRFCSYCIIPYARGRVRSKPLDDIRAEVSELAAHGYREIVLTGINLPSYGQDIGLHLCDAIEAVCAEERIERVRLGSLEPEELSTDVIERMKRQKKLCPQFHLSLQSGCDETLKRMNRRYTAEEYAKIADDLRSAFPNCSITTDIMVGFAGETEEEFEASLEFAKRMRFARVHVFAYSRRAGTRAYDAPNQVPNRIKEERSRRMIAATLENQREFFKTQVSTLQEVLFEQQVDKNVFEGYTPNYTPVRAVSAKDISGQILPVRLTGALDDFCLAELIRP